MNRGSPTIKARHLLPVLGALFRGGLGTKNASDGVYCILNGTMAAMMVSIDKAGRIVIPKSVRDELDLMPESELTLDVEADSIRISRPKRPTRALAFTDDGRPYFPASGRVTTSDLDVQRLRDAQVR